MELILSATGEPFSDKTAAGIKAETLSRELGDFYSVVNHPTGGFAVVRSRKNNASAETTEAANPGAQTNDGIAVQDLPPWEIGTETPPPGKLVNHNLRKQGSTLAETGSDRRPTNSTGEDLAQSAYPNTINLNPAVRSFWHWQLLMVLGAIAAFAPRFFFEYVLQVEPQYVDNIVYWGLLPLMSLIGAMSMATGLVYTVWGYYVDRYHITSTMIETVHGIFSSQRKRIEYHHIRQVNVTQSIVGRIIGYGVVEVATAAETADLVLKNIAHPTQIQEEIYRRKRTASIKNESEHDD